jgi:RNA-directed DNA polymerase
LKEGERRRLDDLETPEQIRTLQEKLYLKAKNEPRFRFYILYDKVHRADFLAHAYELARANGGACGVDGVTFQSIEEGQGVAAFLAELREELRAQTYRAKPVRRVYIPKPTGGMRPLGIPCIRDRVVQGAVLLLLDPIFEADLTDNAWAYRRGRGAHGALKETHRLLRAGYTDVVDADLSKYFDTIPHRELMRCVARRIVDRKLLRLIKMWLKVPVEERDEDGQTHTTGGKKSDRGTPQGGVISPLLANLYMRRFLLAWQQRELPTKLQAVVVNYADDFVILCRHTAEQAKAVAERIIGSMKLAMNAEKTRIVEAWQQSFDFLGYTFGVCYAPETGRPYLGAKPSRVRVQRFYRGLHDYLRSVRTERREDVVLRLNQKLAGWANYYSYGTLTTAYRRLNRLVRNCFRGWLCRRHKVQSRGQRRFPDEALHAMGLLDLERLLVTRRSHARGETSPRAGCGKSARPVR